MITVLVKALETKAAKELRKENAILKVLFKQGIKNNIEYRELLEESLGLLDRYQEEVEKLSLRANLWVDEVVKQYFIVGDLNEALKLTGREIMLFKLNKNKEEM